MPETHSPRPRGDLLAIYLRYLRDYKWSMLAYFVLMFVAFPIEQIVFPNIYGKVVDLLGKPSKRSLFDRTKWYLVGAVGLLILSQALFTLIDTIDAYTLPALQSFYREQLLRDVFETFQREYDTLPTGNVVSKIVKLPLVVRQIYHQLRNYVLPTVIVSVVACGYYAYIDWGLGALLTVVLLAFYTYATVHSTTCIPSSQARDATCDKLHEDVDDTLTNMLAVYTHNRVGRELRRFDKKQTAHDDLYTESSMCAVWFKVWFSVFYIAIFVVVNGYAFYLAHKGRISVGSLVSIIFVNLFLIGNIQDFAGEIRDFVFNLGVMAEIQDYLNTLFGRGRKQGDAAHTTAGATHTAVPPSATHTLRRLALPKGRITFRGVTFRYPGRTTPALKNVSLTIRAGETVAVVGPIGSGKSTVTKLLLRLYTPQQGVVAIDGRDLSQYPPQVVRRHLGYVPQSPVLFDRSLYANLVYGTSPVHVPSKAKVRAFVRRMGVAPLFANVQGGLDARVGKHGEQLSGGQRQAVVLLRLALADAFGHGPKRAVLLLDEPTAALDLRSKQYVLALIRRLAKGRTTVIVTHDAAAVKVAERVVRMEGGRVDTRDAGVRSRLIAGV